MPPPSRAAVGRYAILLAAIAFTIISTSDTAAVAARVVPAALSRARAERLKREKAEERKASGEDDEPPLRQIDLHLLEAATENLPQVTANLVGAGANLEARDPASKHRTPLLRAAASGDNVTVQVLLHFGADVEARDDDGASALALAVSGDACEEGVVAALLRGNAQTDQRGRVSDKTPLMMAAAGGHYACVQALLANGARAHEVDGQGRTAQEIAAAALAAIPRKERKRRLRWGRTLAILETATKARGRDEL